MSVDAPDDAKGRERLLTFPLFDHLILPDLPVPATPLVGRDRELAILDTLFEDSLARLVTLTGPGGIGKTRLALTCAGNIAGTSAFVSLAAVSEPELASATIAQALGLESRPDVLPDESLRRTLKDRKITLVLDNFEHLLSAAPLLSGLLRGCPHLRLLVTSRVRLSLSGEHVVPVEPLSLPGDGQRISVEEIAKSSAVQLFIQRARAAHPAFTFSERNAHAIATICQRLDGLPLAIELAAARSNLLSPPALATRLEHRLSLLTGGPRDAPERLQTMRAAIGWSIGLLESGERGFWERLGVFVGGFSADAAEAVDNGAGSPVPDCLGILEALIDQGLLNPSSNANGEPRFVMLETTREVALDRLEQQGTLDLVRDAHAAWCCAFAKAIEPGLMGNDPDTWFNRAEADIANFRAAISWLRDDGDIATALEIAGALAWFWTAPNYIAEGRRWYSSLLADADDRVAPEIRAKALEAAGDLADWHADTQSAVRLHLRALALWREAGDRSRIAASLRSLGSTAIDRFAFDESHVLLIEAHALAREVGDAWNTAAAANLLGVVAKERGAFAEAKAWHEEALVRWQATGHRDRLPTALCGLGWAHLGLGEQQRAWESFDASVSLSGDGEANNDTAWALVGFAALACRNNQAATAARLLATAARQRTELALPLRPPTEVIVDRLLDEVRDLLGPAALAVEWARGQAITIPEAVREARLVHVPTPAPARGSSLSPREREVLEMLVEGASDHEIADRLFITRRTASKHVAAILEKLDATNRTAAATVAHRRGLV